MNRKGEVGRYDCTIPGQPDVRVCGRRDVSGTGLLIASPAGQRQECAAEVRMRPIGQPLAAQVDPNVSQQVQNRIGIESLKPNRRTGY
jgi:hypothetical protein